eukprot:873768-Rhodomonas_salina.1
MLLRLGVRLHAALLDGGTALANNHIFLLLALPFANTSFGVCPFGVRPVTQCRHPCARFQHF